MVMDTMQIRMNKELTKIMDKLIEQGIYSSRAEIVRDAVRRFVWENEVGTIKNNNKNSVEEIRNIRNKLSKETMNIDEINNFGRLK